MLRTLTRSIAGPRGLPAVLLAGLLVLAACGGDSGDDGEEASTGQAAEDTGQATEALPELDPVFEDGLESDGNGWGEIEAEEFTTGFTPEGYEVTVRGTANWFGYADAGPVSMEDSSTTVTVTDPAGPAERGVGVFCRGQRTGPNEYYALLVDNGRGSWSIERWSSVSPEEPTVLAEGGGDALQGVATDDEAEITGTCLGGGDGEEVELILSVDGDEVGRVTDDDGLGAGLTGLSVGGPAGEDAVPVTFTDVEVAGDEGDPDIELEDDFSDAGSGFLMIEQNGTTAGYDGGAYRVQTPAAFGAGVPVRPPVPPAGTVTVTITGITDAGYAGICLNGADGSAYELALSGGGYASLGHYGADGTFTLIDEATDAWTAAAPRLSAGWNTDGSTTRLDLYVDDQQLLTAVDDRVTAFRDIGFCGTVSSDAPAGSSLDLTYDDLVVVGEG